MKNAAGRASAVRVAGRIAKLAVLTLLGLEMGYLLLANLLLGTGLLASLLSRNPDALALDLASGWTVWPGRVHVRDLSLRSASDSIEWVLRTEHAVVDVELRELLSKRFHASRVRGEGFSFRLRLRLKPEEADLPRARALPPIPGFDDPPILRAGAPGETGHPWTVRIEDIDIGYRELWFQHYRYVGEGRTRGGFFMDPEKRIEVFPSVVDGRDGELTLAEHTVATGVEARVSGALAPFDPRVLGDIRVFDVVSAHVDVTAQIPGLDFLDFYLPPSSGLAVVEGSGEIDAHVDLRNGTVTQGSRAALRTRAVEIMSPALRATIGGELSLEASEASTVATLRAPRATLDRRDLTVSPIVVEGGVVALDVDALRLGEPPSRAGLRVRVPAAAIPDLRFFKGGSPDAPKLRGGAAFFEGSLHVDADGHGTGRLAALVKGAEMTWKDARLRGDATARFDIQSADVAARRVRLGPSRVALRDVRFERHRASGGGTERAAPPAWWANIDVRQSRLEHGLAETELTAECASARPVLGLLATAGALPAWAVTLLQTAKLSASLGVARRGPLVDLQLHDARGAGLDVRGRLKKRDGGKADGGFLIASGPLSVGVDISAQGTAVKPLAGEAWIRGRMAALDAPRPARDRRPTGIHAIP